MKKKVVYVVVMIEADLRQLKDSTYAVEPLGVYTTPEEAQKYVDELEDITPESTNLETAYDVFEFELDAEPLMLAWLKKQDDLNRKAIEDAVIDLMKEGLVDQLIGEDGRFYYTLTDRGQKSFDEMKNDIPSNVKKFFKKDKDND